MRVGVGVPRERMQANSFPHLLGGHVGAQRPGCIGVATHHARLGTSSSRCAL